MNIGLILSILILLYLITFFCEIFTNAVEHLGKYFKIQDGALGSIFAAVGTALPETILPLIAVFGAYVSGTGMDLGKDIGKGAVLGSPFMLSSLAFFMIALMIVFLSIKGKRTSDVQLDVAFFRRDLNFFTAAYTVGILTALVEARFIQIAVGIFLLIYYVVYAARTIRKHCCKGEYCEGECEELKFLTFFKADESKRLFLIFLQFFIAIAGLVISSHYFVENIKTLSTNLGFSAMLISLFLAPVATELPETVNGLVWSYNNKDTLAVSNVSGAMVFQSCIPMAIGIFFTDWKFSVEAAANVAAVYLAVIILYFVIAGKKDKFSAKPLLLSILPYVLYVAFSVIYTN